MVRTSTWATLGLASLCAVLNVLTGIYIALAYPQRAIPSDTTSAFWVISIVNSAFFGLLAIVDMCLWLKILSKHRRIRKASLCTLNIATLALAGVVLGHAQLSTSTHTAFGGRFCGWTVERATNDCLWSGDRALLLGFIFWLSTGILQSIYTAIYMTRAWGFSQRLSPQTPMRFGVGSGDSSMMNDTPIRPPIGQALGSPTMSLQEKAAFRYPLRRNETAGDDDAFTLEKVLANYEGSSLSVSEKSSNARDRPHLEHAAASSSSGWTSQHHHASSSLGSSKPAGSVRFHSTHLSNAQSWTSSRPNITSGLSPMVTRGKRAQECATQEPGSTTPRQSPGGLSQDSPASKRRSSTWETLGIALGSPSKAIGLLSTGISSALRSNSGTHTAQSSISSGKSKQSKRITNLRFHLPKSSISGLDIPPVPTHTGDTPELNMSPMTVSTFPTDSHLDAHSSPTQTDPTTSLPASPVRLQHPTGFASLDLSPQTKPLRPKLRPSPMKYVPDLKMSAVSRSATLPVVIGEPQIVSGEALARTQTAGLQTSPVSMQRKRSSILDSLKPRLPEGRSLSRASWQIGQGRQQSPTRGSRRHSRQLSPSRRPYSQSQQGIDYGARRMSDADLAFAEWDTSHVETDPAYLVDIRDSRDMSGPLASPLNSPMALEEMTPRMGGMVLSRGGFFQSPGMQFPMSPGLFDGSGRDEELDPWQGRDVRVRSDGSVIHKETLAESSMPLQHRPIPPAFAARSQSLQTFGLGLSSQGALTSPRRFSQAPLTADVSTLDVRQVVEAAGIRVSSIAAPERRHH